MHYKNSRIKRNPTPTPGTGKIRNATKLIIDGIEFKSKLEAYCYVRLKEENIENTYEKYTFTLQPTFEYKGTIFEYNKRTKEFKKATNSIKAITYKPDFVSINNKWVIECKGFPNDAFPIKWKMFKYKLQSEGYTLYLPKTQKQIDIVISMIKEGKNGTI
jgi:hypothetical protein